MNDSSPAPAIEVANVVKRFGDVVAVDGVSLSVPPASVLGLLGPNGAGKTTIVRMLTTILKPDGGTATVLGIDVAKDPNAVREVIGLAGQYAAVDENLTGRENLEMVGRLTHLPKRAIVGEGRRVAGAVRTDACGGTHGQDLLRRHAPAARPRARRSCTSRPSSSSTSRPPVSTRRRATTCGR